MGVYIIKSLHADWFKLGHHKISERRPNVFYRYINRGFYSCKCPEEIKNKVGFDDLQLIYWFINLDINDEHNIHSQLKQNFHNMGEWYKYSDLEKIVTIIENEYNGITKMPTIEEYNYAKKWCNNLKLHK
jgi:hypothetical protein